MTKLHITAAAVILSAVMLLGGCSGQSGDHGSDASPDTQNSTSSIESSETESGANAAFKSSENSDPESPENPDTPQEYHGDGFISYVPVVSAVDVLDIRPIEKLPEIPHEIGGYPASMLKLIKPFDTIYALMVVREHGDRTSEGRELEFGVYNFTDQTYTTLFKTDDYGGYGFNCSYSKGQLFFSTLDDSWAYIWIKFNSDQDISKFDIVRMGEGLHGGADVVVGEDGLFYFNATVLEPFSEGIYSYDPASGEEKRVVQDGYSPFCYKDQIFYHVGNYRTGVVNTVSGKYAYDSDQITLIDENNILLKEDTLVNDQDGALVYDAVTSKKLFSVEVKADRREHNGDYVNVGFGYSNQLTYDLRENVVIEYDERYEFFQQPEWNDLGFGIIREWEGDGYQYFMVTRK